MTLGSRLALLALVAAPFAGGAAAQEPPKLVLPQPSPGATTKQTVGLTDITIVYSSPAVRGRKVWGDLVPFDELWRAGANQCTKVTFSTAASIGGKPVPAGTYCLFLLPARTGWTFVLNKDTNLWGTGDYKQENDVLRVPAATTAIPARERLAFEVLDFNEEGGTLALEWDTLRIGVKFEVATRAAVLAAIRALQTDDWRPYVSAARYLLDAKTEPALAMTLVDRSIQLKEEWSNLWVKSQLLAAAGKPKEAVALAQRAQELGKKSPNFSYYAEDVAKAVAEWSKK
jgi:hypothetical protein